MSIVVIGTGADELVAALYLARAGRSVTLVEQHAPDARPAEGWVLPAIAADLELERHGWRLERVDPWIDARTRDGQRLQLWHDVGRSVESIRKLSAADAAEWPKFCARLRSVSAVLEAWYARPPPDPMTEARGELWRLASLAWNLRRRGRETIEDLLRVLPMPVADLLEDSFECDLLKGALAMSGVTDAPLGPRSAGTAFGLAHRHAGAPLGVFRPARSNLNEVLKKLAEGNPSIEWRREPAIGIDIDNGRVAGVRFQSGTRVDADTVLSGLHPVQTLLELTDPVWIDPELQRAVRNIRSRGVSANVVLSLPGASDFQRLCLAPSLDSIERAYDDSKYGQASRALVVEAAHEGAHRVSAHVQYVPSALQDRELGERIARLPEFAGAVLERVEKQPRHAELALDQFLWMRPVPQLARYRAPIKGLYLCGASMHPGQGVPGASGVHSAHAALKETQREG